MPNINGKKFPYTAKGMKAAKMAADKKKEQKPKKRAKGRTLMKDVYK
tara:strand:- start:5816 stop:5956 length:141 start_codon:yes stop_codon:yes gene_type:complete